MPLAAIESARLANTLSLLMTTKSAINFRTTYILMGLVAALLAGLAIYVWVSEDTKPNPQGILLESLYNIGAKSDQITGLEIDRGGQKIVFSRQADGRWFIVQPIKARADSTLVENIVHQLLTARREEKNVDIVDNLSVHGLDNPPVKISLRRGDRTATMSLGKVTVGGEQSVVYVLTSDQPKKAQATLKKRLSALFKEKAPDAADSAAHLRDLDDFRTRTLLGEGIELEAAPIKLIGVRIRAGKDKELYLSRNNRDKVWRFVKPEGYGDVETMMPGDKELDQKIHFLGRLLKTILTIDVPSPKDFLVGPQDLTKLGLDPTSPNVMQIELERDDDIRTEKLWISGIEAKDQLDKVYVRYGDEDVVAMTNGANYRLLRNLVNDPTELRDRSLVKLRNDRVDAIDVIQGGKKAFELRKVAGRWKVFEGDKAVDADSRVINDFLMLLTQPRAVRGFPASGAKDDMLGFDKPAVELQIWEDGIAEAKKDDPNAKPKLRETPTARILFGNPEDNTVVNVRRFIGAGKVDVKMPIGLLDDARRDRLAYIQVPLNPFRLADVTKVLIPRGGNTYEIERTDATRWTIAAPPAKKGKLANADKINNLLQALVVMQPQGIAAEKPDTRQLQNFGLDKPKLKIAVQIRGETGERIWSFGDPVPKTDWVYAKSNQSDFVIKVSKQFAEIAGQGELVDPRLFQITAPEVEGIKLLGWSEILEMPHEITLIHKPGKLWEAAKKDTVFTSERVEAFLTTILGLQAETIVVEKGKPEEHHGLDVNKGALEITIDLGGGKKQVLILGNFVSKESKLIYALFNKDIVTIKAEQLLIDVKAKPTGLR
jgi:Domain of unknown function (DUF4340)